MVKGINPKKWFYSLREDLSAEQNRPCVLAGAACEQWINGQLFRVIAEGLEGTKLTVYSEWNRRQHDVAIIRHSPSDPGAWYDPVAVVESKLVYLNYSENSRNKSIDRLIEQLTAEHKNCTTRVGFLFGIYAYWPEYKKKKETFSGFRLGLGRLFRERASQGVPGFEVILDHKGAMETVLDETYSKVGAAEVVVGCVAQYIRLIKTK